MEWPDEKIVAILALLVIAFTVIGVTEEAGLDVVINIVCSVGGMITGYGMAIKKNGG